MHDEQGVKLSSIRKEKRASRLNYSSYEDIVEFTMFIVTWKVLWITVGIYNIPEYKDIVFFLFSVFSYARLKELLKDVKEEFLTEQMSYMVLIFTIIEFVIQIAISIVGCIVYLLCD